jgi:hypothetical protein
MNKRVASLALALVSFMLLAFTPPPGSPERAKIMEAVRASFEKKLGGPVKFKVDRLDVDGDYAFAQLHPLKPDGSPYRILRPDPMNAYGDALLVRRSGAWQLLDMRLDATDVWYCALTISFPKKMLPDC